MRLGNRIRTVEKMTSKDMGGKGRCKGYSPTGDGRGRNTSEHETKTNERQALTSGHGSGGDESKHGREVAEGGALTH